MMDFENPACRIECRAVGYRSGFIEVGITHPRHVNLETWNIDPDKVKPGTDIRGGRFPEDAAVGNTEIVMTLDEASRLVALLTEAIERQGG